MATAAIPFAAKLRRISLAAAAHRRSRVLWTLIAG